MVIKMKIELICDGVLISKEIQFLHDEAFSVLYVN